MILRPYQRSAIDAAYKYLTDCPGNPCIEIPTGGGKSAILATICQETAAWGGRVLAVSHVKELLEQLHETLGRIWPDGKCGLNSAGLKRRDTDHQVIVAGIQSIYRRACDLGRFDLVIIDESHLLPPDGDGMYQTLLSDLRVINPSIRVIGLTATPYRLDSGTICGSGKFFSDICYSANVKDLIADGYLSQLRGKNGGSPDLSGVHKRGGEYIESELSDVMSDPERVSNAVEEMRRHGDDRNAWIVFCCGVSHARMVNDALVSSGIDSRLVTGETESSERKESIDLFKARKLRCLVNVSVLTTGFDAPHVDLVVMLRPTCSPGLYAQMVGRGLRKADGKENCIILDLAGNIEAHGPIDRIIPPGEKRGEEAGEAPSRTCPNCEEIHSAAMKVCPSCGHVYPESPSAKHGTVASESAPLSSDESARVEREVEVSRVDVAVHHKKGSAPGDGSPRTVRLTYWADMRTRFSEWICVEHQGFARRKAEDWFAEIGGDPAYLPRNADEAKKCLIDRFEFIPIKSILVRENGGDWPEVIRRYSEQPQSIPSSEEIPF